MRIVAGTAGGRRLVVPAGDTTRPTTDRVREAIFNALFSLDLLEDRTFADLFCGSGALGLEALSRGAAHVTFVERDRAALDAVRTNIDTIGFAAQSAVHAGDAVTWLGASVSVDVVLADPPYDFDQWSQLLHAADRAGAEFVVAETGKQVPDFDDWSILRQRGYGSTVVTFLARPSEDAL